jgi:ubiquinone/menaquinone biosynthesis C-methylase UbiE
VKQKMLNRVIKILRLNERPNFKAIPISDYVDVSKKLEDNWRNEDIPELQWNVVSLQIENLRHGILSPEFQSLVTLLGTIPGIENWEPICLEIGCSSGYYSEVIARHFPKIVYSGCDYSPSFIAKAKDLYPQVFFRVENTTSLSFADQSVDISISGSVLLHVPDWKKGLSETMRITRKYLILHRTPVYNGATTLFTKFAYESEVIEWSFSKDEIIEQCVQMGFELIQEINVYEGQKISKEVNSTIQQSYLFKRKVQ